MDPAPLRVGILHDFPRPDGGAAFEWALRLGVAEVEATGRLPRPIVFSHEPATTPRIHCQSLRGSSTRARRPRSALTTALAVRPLADDAGVACINMRVTTARAAVAISRSAP
jgi:hypothetical protein